MNPSKGLEIVAVAFASDGERWDALLRRDRAADGVFWYSVRTTGVYCRPSCGARRPRRENVDFHLSRDAAERAGFRACKRCRPREATLDERRSAVITRACRRIEAADRAPDLDTLAAAAGMSRFHFQRLFKAITGVTPKSYADALRGRRLRDGLATVGHSRITATEHLGMPSTTYRKGGIGETIHFAVGGCALGAILVAATAKGICAILLGDDAETLLRELQDRFPKANLAPGDAEFERTVGAVVGFLDQPGPRLDLPLDIRGTAFQQRVWQALRAIPPGSTATYTEIADRIGFPQAVRAVAHACASNPLAVAIPCHRVVRQDGSLAGYRWGIERKRDLIERERTAASRLAAGEPADSSQIKQ